MIIICIKVWKGKYSRSHETCCNYQCECSYVWWDWKLFESVDHIVDIDVDGIVDELFFYGFAHHSSVRMIYHTGHIQRVSSAL